MAVSIQPYEHLEEKVLHLPRMDRSRLASRLLESLEEDEHELSLEWREELQRRANDIDSGKQQLVSADVVWKKINHHFGTAL